MQSWILLWLGIMLPLHKLSHNESCQRTSWCCLCVSQSVLHRSIIVLNPLEVSSDVVFEFDWRAISLGSLTAKLLSAPLGMREWTWPSMYTFPHYITQIPVRSKDIWCPSPLSDSSVFILRKAFYVPPAAVDDSFRSSWHDGIRGLCFAVSSGSNPGEPNLLCSMLHSRPLPVGSEACRNCVTCFISCTFSSFPFDPSSQQPYWFHGAWCRPQYQRRRSQQIHLLDHCGHPGWSLLAGF